MATQLNEDEEAKILSRIEKMLRLADDKRGNEAEAANALRMAQQLADAYNIDVEGVRQGSTGNHTGKASPRQQDDFAGGLYPYQRNLYAAIARLNHSLYWYIKGTKAGGKYQHRLVGSKINVLLAKQMGQYLQQTVERLAREYVGNDPKRYFTKEAHLFREGVVDRIIEKIEAKRREDVAEAARKRAEEAARTSHPGAAPGNHLVLIDDVIQREAEANYDYQYGEGAWARYQAVVAESRAKRLKANADYEQWKLDHPEEHARQEAEREKEAEKARKREERNANRRKGGYRYSKPSKYDHDAYWDGSAAGKDVSLDRQVDGGAKGYIE